MLRFLSSRFAILMGLWLISPQLMATAELSKEVNTGRVAIHKKATTKLPKGVHTKRIATENATVKQQDAGIVLATRGSVTTRKGRILKRKDHFGVGDEIRTRASSFAQLRLNDGTLITLDANSSYVVEKMNLTASNNKSITGHLVTGTLKHLSGEDKKIQRILIAPVISMALRGTSAEVKTKEIQYSIPCVTKNQPNLLRTNTNKCVQKNGNNCLPTKTKNSRCVASRFSTKVKVLSGRVDLFQTSMIPDSLDKIPTIPLRILREGQEISYSTYSNNINNTPTAAVPNVNPTNISSNTNNSTPPQTLTTSNPIVESPTISETQTKTPEPAQTQTNTWQNDPAEPPIFPSTDNDGASTSNTENGGTSTPNTENDGTSTPNTENDGTSTPNTENDGTSTSNTGSDGMQTPNENTGQGSTTPSDNDTPSPSDPVDNEPHNAGIHDGEDWGTTQAPSDNGNPSSSDPTYNDEEIIDSGDTPL